MNRLDRASSENSWIGGRSPKAPSRSRLHPKSAVAFIACVESLHIMTDVMADDDAVAQISPELLQGRRETIKYLWF